MVKLEGLMNISKNERLFLYQPRLTSCAMNASDGFKKLHISQPVIVLDSDCRYLITIG